MGFQIDGVDHHGLPFAMLGSKTEAAVAVLHNDVLPFYRNLDLPVGAVLTDNGREFCGTERHPYELYLDLNGIEHRRYPRSAHRKPTASSSASTAPSSTSSSASGCARPSTKPSRRCRPISAWLVHYNTERPHLGYRNMGRRPIETIMSFVSQED